jgi:hypothetical protein
MFGDQQMSIVVDLARPPTSRLRLDDACTLRGTQKELVSD